MNHACDPPSPPAHRRPSTAEWWRGVVDDFALEPHQLRLMQLACEAWDRCQEARAALTENGLTYTDRFGAPRARPEVAIERDGRIAFARLLRELALDVTAPAEEYVRRPAAPAAGPGRAGVG